MLLIQKYLKKDLKIHVIFMWIQPGQRKKGLNFAENLEHILNTKIPKFLQIPFSIMYFQIDFGFLVDSIPKVMSGFS